MDRGAIGLLVSSALSKRGGMARGLGSHETILPRFAKGRPGPKWLCVREFDGGLRERGVGHGLICEPKFLSVREFDGGRAAGLSRVRISILVLAFERVAAGLRDRSNQAARAGPRVDSRALVRFLSERPAEEAGVGTIRLEPGRRRC